MPALDLSLPEAGLGFIGGALGFLAGPAVGLMTLAIGWIIGHDVAVQKRRRRNISAIKKKYQEIFQEKFDHIGVQASERVSATAQGLLQQVRGRLETFIADARRRIDRLGSPLTADAIARLQRAAVQVALVRERTELIGRELAGMLDQTPGEETA